MNKTVWVGLGILVIIVAVGGYLLYGRSGAYQTPSSNPTENATGTYGPSQAPGITSPSASPTGVTKKFTVTAKEYSFTPSTITVNQGDNVVITFKNMGTFSHNLTIGDLNLATNTISPGQSATLTFIAGQPGTYAFYCTVDGHRDMGMQGSLEVK